MIVKYYSEGKMNVQLSPVYKLDDYDSEEGYDIACEIEECDGNATWLYDVSIEGMHVLVSLCMHHVELFDSLVDSEK